MFKIHPLIKFKKFWDNLDNDSQVELWKFLTGLRGPDDLDDEDKDLKHNTTGVIRSYLLKFDNKCPATVNRTGEFLIKKDLTKILQYDPNSLFQNYESHFKNHAKDAMRVIKKSKLKRII